MFGRKLIALGVLLATQLVSGCCWCGYRPLFCCGHRYFAPNEPCTTCYQPAAPAPVYPVMQGAPIPYMRSGPVGSGTSGPINPPSSTTTPPGGTIPSFPTASAVFTNGQVR